MGDGEGNDCSKEAEQSDESTGVRERRHSAATPARSLPAIKVTLRTNAVRKPICCCPTSSKAYRQSPYPRSKARHPFEITCQAVKITQGKPSFNTQLQLYACDLFIRPEKLSARLASLAGAAFALA
jgi:hypothetical protein